ncbi:MAG: hypothetical protein EOO25_01590 [Comamonadaceae bacterium]|nr:MAG: hypothetical protein EOO25_01590 [Comamonadaceae bacterium]
MQRPPLDKTVPSAPASPGSGNGADSALAEMIRKRTVHIVETDQQLQNLPLSPVLPSGKR